jgi:hypothetical protein
VTFLARWLRLTPVPRADGFVHVDELTVTGQLDEAELEAALGHELRRNYVDRAALEAIFEDLGVPEVARHLRDHVFPGPVHLRHGEFGEAITGAHFRTVRRYCMPILKLRYKQGRDRPVFGADVLAFRLRVQPPVVAVPEAKTLANRDLNIGVEGYTSLEKVLSRLDESLHFVVARTAERGNAALASRIGALLRGKRTVERHIMIVQDATCWDDRVVERLAAAAEQPVSLTVLRLAGLRELVAAAYKAAAENLTHGA